MHSKADPEMCELAACVAYDLSHEFPRQISIGCGASVAPDMLAQLTGPPPTSEATGGFIMITNIKLALKRRGLEGSRAKTSQPVPSVKRLSRVSAPVAVPGT